ncbi:Hypothetical protein SRAE_2000359800 [Strongyloides ratti]|uniref:Lipoprotein n=1 Tax=Strongyloides ratti TaxID=34506 RepID=A0A090MZH5_STRRB|nr:Hypothetical protein SRAE_2000359800 [Strongyloides ratti]CEF68944.1 Hypothetical protein SRAE_2000359800 [Strongyloides ratti]
MSIKEYFYILFFLFLVFLSSHGCNSGTKNQKKNKPSVKKKGKVYPKKKPIDGKINDKITNDKNDNDKTENKGDTKKSRKSVRPPRFYPDANQMRYDGKKEASLKIDKTQSKPSIIKDSGKILDNKGDRIKNPSDTNRIPLDKTLPSKKSEINRPKVKEVVVKEVGKYSIIDGGLQSSRKDNKNKNDEEMSSPDLNKETKDETTNLKEKMTENTKEPTQAGGTSKKGKKTDDPRPKKIELDEKEKLIATGAIAKKKKTDYPTMDDVLSDWDTEKEKAGQNLGKDPLSDNGKKNDSLKNNEEIAKEPEVKTSVLKDPEVKLQN